MRLQQIRIPGDEQQNKQQYRQYITTIIGHYQPLNSVVPLLDPFDLDQTVRRQLQITVIIIIEIEIEGDIEDTAENVRMTVITKDKEMKDHIAVEIHEIETDIMNDPEDMVHEIEIRMMTEDMVLIVRREE